MLLTILAIILSIVALATFIPMLVVIALKSVPLAIVVGIVLAFVFGLTLHFGIKFSKKKDKPFYLLVIVAFALVGIIITIILRPIIIDIIQSILQPIGPGGMVNPINIK